MPLTAGLDEVLEITSPVSRRLVAAGPPVTFGRGRYNDIVLDPGDVSISRKAGEISYADGHWRVINRSGSRPLYTVDDTGLRLVLGVGQARWISTRDSAIHVVGSRLTHVIGLHLKREAVPVAEEASDDAHDRTLMPSFSDNELVAVVAVCEGFLLDPPRYSASPRSYAEAAARLGIDATPLRKAVERVRQKLVHAGVVELEGGDCRAELCEFLLATSLVNRGHLSLLP